MTQNPTTGVHIVCLQSVQYLLPALFAQPVVMSDIDARFKKAVWLIRNGPKQDSSNETKLLYYRCHHHPPPPPFPDLRPGSAMLCPQRHPC